MEAESLLGLMVSVIIGNFIGHLLYDIYKAHKTNKGRRDKR